MATVHHSHLDKQDPEKNGLPLVSVIIPTYNVEKYIGRCMDSIIIQSYSNLEIIPVDDGSTDRCGAILDQYAGQDHRIQVIHQENQGRIAVRKTGIEHATGDYLFFVDADDWIEPRAIELLIHRALETNADVTMGYHEDVDSEGNRKPSFFPCRDWIFNRDEYVRQMMNCQISGSICTKLFKRGTIQPSMCNFPRDYSAAEDLVINCGTFRYISKAVGVGRVLYNYYMREDSICHTFIPRISYYRELFTIAVQNIGSELAVRYETELRQCFLRVYIDIIYSELFRNNCSYAKTKSFVFVRHECKNKHIISTLPWKYRLKALLIQHPHWLHLTAHGWLLLRHKKKWKPFIQIENS